MNGTVVDILRDLVRLPSVNPMGRPVSGDEYYEYRVTDYVEQFCQRLGLPVARQNVAPRRDNIQARLDGGAGLVVLEAHQDTVPVDGMSIPPWDAALRDGRVFGRGACDIKGGLACHLATLARLVQLPSTRRPTVVLACTVNEEHGFSGARAMSQAWRAGDGGPAAPARTPNAVMVAEPTELNVVVAHKGIVRWRCRTRGRAAHSSRPEQGENAIYRMGHVLVELEHYAQRFVGALGEHPLVGRPTLSVGLIAGGISVNTVPDECAIEIDRRLLPGEDPLIARQHAIGFLAERLPRGWQIEHEPPFIAAPGLDHAGNEELASRIARRAAPRGGGQCVGVPYGTDAPFFAELGAPTIVFGPGSIAQAHTADEWIAVDQLEAACEILFELLTGDDWS